MSNCEEKNVAKKSFEHFFHETQQVANHFLSEFLSSKASKNLVADYSYPADKIYEAMNYSVINGGKRIRPVLCCMVADAFGINNSNIVQAACSVELIHAYSLIHDDLPAMDDADLRRGKPSNHKVYGEATAILAGDALLTMAFEWLSDLNLGDNKSTKIHCERMPQAIRILAECAGAKGMVGGQMLDLEAEGKTVELDYLIKMHEGKTSALLEAPILIGFVLSADDLTGFDTLKEYGRKIGLLFQIVDDILDVEGDASKLGKAIGKDAEAHKATYPSILGLEKSKEYAKKIHDEAVNLLDAFIEERKKVDSIQKCDLSKFYGFTDYLLTRDA